MSAEREIPLSRWLFGASKALYRMSCDLDETTRRVRFREMTRESSWGLLPPSGRADVTSQSGTRVRQATSVMSPAGGGRFDIGRIRDAVEASVAAAGWQFDLDAGRCP